MTPSSSASWPAIAQQQRRLPGPVAPDEADALVRVDREIGAIEQRMQPERELRSANRQQGHRARIARRVDNARSLADTRLGGNA